MRGVDIFLGSLPLASVDLISWNFSPDDLKAFSEPRSGISTFSLEWCKLLLSASKGRSYLG